MLDDSAIRLADYCSMRGERDLNALSIRLAGEFDLTCERRFRDELARLLDGEIDTFLLDLRGLRFIDSTGLRLLLQIEALARREGFDFTVLCGDGQVRDVLRATGLDGVLAVVDLSGGLVPASDSPV